MRIDRELESAQVICRAEQLSVIEIGKHRVALVNLALADGPEIDRAVDNTLMAACLYLSAQSETIELGVLEALVKLLVDLEVGPQVTCFCQVQRVSVAQFTRRTQHAVVVEK